MSVESVLYAHNVSYENFGLISRSADIFGVSSIYYYHDHNKNIDKKRLSKLSRNSNIPIFLSDGIDSILNLKANGYQIAALEITDTSTSIRLGSFSRKTCLIVGNEKDGIPQDILNVADCSYHIDMIGGNISSLNVSIAASIALYEISQLSLSKEKI